ncbi:MAG: hypothetical protein EHM66_00465 [Deltaproteobacteria bacterium]|nr:MAG: hypothetical protein EHM66_00465 [Deltaproteobacteria bacterium]
MLEASQKDLIKARSELFKSLDLLRMHVEFLKTEIRRVTEHVKDMPSALTKAEFLELKQRDIYEKVIGVLQSDPVNAPRYTQADIVRICGGVGVSRRKVIEAINTLIEDGLVERRVDKQGFKIALTEEGWSFDMGDGTNLV